MRIYLITIEASPLPDTNDDEDAGGAFVNTWLCSSSMAEARQAAVDNIEEQGWAIVQVEEECEVSRDSIPDDCHEFYDLAVQGEVVALWHKWPTNESDED